jgi:hypothetical protein
MKVYQKKPQSPICNHEIKCARVSLKSVDISCEQVA